MLVNKEKRIKYIGFDDFWFSVLGILILGIASIYLFNASIFSLSFVEAIITIVVVLIFSITDWIINRAFMIFLRMKYPYLKDSVQRILFLLLAVVFTVVSVDFIGTKFFSYFSLNVTYNFQERAKALLTIIFISIMTMAIYEAIYFYVRLKKSIREEEQSKQAIIQAQLDALRNQAQPHFFFNTLNTLRDIIDQNSIEDAKEFVDKLSDMYRFLLEAGNANLITLRDELKFSKAYIHIQSERFGDNLKLNWNIPKASLDAMIVPMSLQLLLENAIKHNVISRAKPLEININIEDNCVTVDNRIQIKSTQLPSTKVGLKNIEKRYALITGKSVEIVNNGNHFSVSLPLLKTSEHKNSYGNINN
ncbi:histidine kinase [Arenibacter sp. F26102]|uniref:sensor histidine kinase n=1 Tax=Arenibacter sp. F26102 TaxID=2926416 RepID=UPI001FF4CC03|nr:histidine kinase [Arenibacter sp. F26102]MCK0145819.1 histidine kinase [Arenibacter sp. F26102]